MFIFTQVNGHGQRIVMSAGLSVSPSINHKHFAPEKDSLSWHWLQISMKSALNVHDPQRMSPDEVTRSSRLPPPSGWHFSLIKNNMSMFSNHHPCRNRMKGPTSSGCILWCNSDGVKLKSMNMIYEGKINKSLLMMLLCWSYCHKKLTWTLFHLLLLLSLSVTAKTCGVFFMLLRGAWQKKNRRSRPTSQDFLLYIQKRNYNDHPQRTSPFYFRQSKWSFLIYNTYLTTEFSRQQQDSDSTMNSWISMSFWPFLQCYPEKYHNSSQTKVQLNNHYVVSCWWSSPLSRWTV